jgi:fucose 4-O-acetylase-like acetyltransferase
MNIPLILFAVSIVSSPLIIDQAYGQTDIEVGETMPCFMNYTAGSQMWKNCDFAGDPIGATLFGFEWVTGGLFSMIIVALIVVMVYIKYHTVIYPIAIGIIMLPTSFYLFPEEFVSYAFVMAGVGIAALIYGIIILQTRDR